MGENLYTIGNEEDRRILLNNDKCDKYDYLVAVACGAIGGVIDAFFVGAPGESKLGDLQRWLAGNLVLIRQIIQLVQ